MSETHQELLASLKVSSQFVGALFQDAIAKGDRKTVQECLVEQQRIEREIKELER